VSKDPERTELKISAVSMINHDADANSPKKNVFTLSTSVTLSFEFSPPTSSPFPFPDDDDLAFFGDCLRDFLNALAFFAAMSEAAAVAASARDATTGAGLPPRSTFFTV